VAPWLVADAGIVPSSLYFSHRPYRPTISCAMVATKGKEMFKDARKVIGSFVALVVGAEEGPPGVEGFPGVVGPPGVFGCVRGCDGLGAPSFPCEAWRDERRGVAPGVRGPGVGADDGVVGSYPVPLVEEELGFMYCMATS
jgi:hypothetical protein